MVSDYLWARAIVLTSPVMATVGLSITIPLAFLADIVLNGYTAITVNSIVGSVLVMAGFVLVNQSYQGEAGGGGSSVGEGSSNSKDRYIEGSVVDAVGAAGAAAELEYASDPSPLHQYWDRDRESGRSDMRVSIASAEL